VANAPTIKTATPYRLVVSMAGDGTVAGPTLDNAAIVAALPAGPLKDTFSAVYADQAAMRAALLYGNPVQMFITMQTTVNDTTAQVNQCAVDVDTDAVSPTKPEINFAMSDTTGQVAILTVQYNHSLVR
jgi:microcystin degradation protein MlrC